MTQTAEAFTTIAAAITERRTIKQFLPEPVGSETITKLIELATWAPNHRLNEPWRFYVLTGDARARLGEIAGGITAAKVGAAGGDPAVTARKAQEAAAGWANVPTLLFITMLNDPNPEVHLENYGAVCCAIQNLTLAAHVLGIGTSWSSGAVAAAPELLTLVGAGNNERMVGLLRLGYLDAAAPTPKSRRTPGESFTRWIE
ncbi:MAG: nitroreductase [Caldilineaceae bacterium]|nr:nitroreductase [Caldilineaceae bacterium]